MKPLKFKQLEVVPTKYEANELYYHHRLYALTEDGDIVYNDVTAPDGKGTEVEVPVESLWYKVSSPTSFVNHEDEEVGIEISDFLGNAAG